MSRQDWFVVERTQNPQTFSVATYAQKEGEAAKVQYLAHVTDRKSEVALQDAHLMAYAPQLELMLRRLLLAVFMEVGPYQKSGRLHEVLGEAFELSSVVSSDPVYSRVEE